MDFKDMSYILAIAKYQNITKAASSLYISQPTLTKFLQKLEKDLNQKLFKRMGNKFILTYAGERYVAKAMDILKLKSELDHEMNDIINSNIGVLKVAFPVMRGTYMLPCTLPIFQSLYPHVELSIYEGNSIELEERLLTGETDLAFFNLPTRSSDISYEIICHEEILLVLSADHPLANTGIPKMGCKYPWIDLSLFKNEKFILYLPDQRTRQIEDSLFQEYGFEPKIMLVTRNIQASCLLASAGRGICFVSESHLKHIHFEKKPIVFSVGNPCTTVDFVAAYRKGSYIPYHAQEYIKIVRDFT